MTKVLKKQITVTVEGRRKRMPVAEAVFLQLIEQAGRGRAFAIREVVAGQRAIEAAEAEAAKAIHADPAGGKALIHFIVCMEEVMEALFFLGFIYLRPDGELVFDRRMMGVLLDHVGLEAKDLPKSASLSTPREEAGGPTPMRAGGLYQHFIDLVKEGKIKTQDDDII